MTTENNNPIPLSELDPILHNCFMGNSQVKQASYKIQSEGLIISPTGTGIVLNPEVHSELVVVEKGWYLKSIQKTYGGEQNA